MRRSTRKLPLISSLEGRLGSSSGAVNTNSHMFHKHYDGHNKSFGKGGRPFSAFTKLLYYTHYMIKSRTNFVISRIDFTYAMMRKEIILMASR